MCVPPSVSPAIAPASFYVTIGAYKLLQTVRFYDVNANEQKAKFDHRAAVLACCFGGASHAYSGGLDTVVRECVTSLYSIAIILTVVPADWNLPLRRSTISVSIMTPFPA